MDGELLPSSDHVAHYCSSTRLDDDAELPRATAFTRAEGDTRAPSGIWLEYLGAADRPAEIAQARVVAGARLTLRVSGRLVVLNVGDAMTAVAAKGHDISFVHKPEDGYESHAEIHGFPEAGSEQELLISAVLKKLVTRDDVYPALA